MPKTKKKRQTKKAYAPEELVDALVVDSAGYICGRVDNVTVEKGTAVVKIYETEMESKPATDLSKLETALLSKVKKRIGKPQKEDLYRQIMKEMDVGEVTTETLEKYALRKRISIPKKTVSKSKKTAKGTIAWRNVRCINSTELGTCILLKVPMEAVRRGVKLKKGVPYQAYEELGPKLVVDSEGKIVGNVEGLRFNTKGPHLHLLRSFAIKREEPDAEKLRENILSQTNMNERELGEQISENLDLDDMAPVTSENLVYWAREEGYLIPTKKIEDEKKIHLKHVIPWTRIRKIGDVVLLDKSIEEITEGEWEPFEKLESKENTDVEEEAEETIVEEEQLDKTCPLCDTANELSAKYCRRCGEKL
jgi:sporulation protein YlmC with PRC-barrel domain/ribosomal protein L40E